MAEAGIAASGEDYNVYVPVINSLGALGKKDALANRIQQRIQVLEAHLRKVPEDARGRETDHDRAVGVGEDAVDVAQAQQLQAVGEELVHVTAPGPLPPSRPPPAGCPAGRRSWYPR